MADKIRKIEIEFELPVDLTDQEAHSLNNFVNRICKRNCPEGWAFWPAGCGSKPTFSQADALFMGKSIDPDAPETGEPTWDHAIYVIDCCARELSPKEIELSLQRGQQSAARAARWDSRLAGWLHRRCMKRLSWMIADTSIWLRKRMHQGVRRG